MRRVFFRFTWLALGALIAVVLLEVVLRLLPVSMGLYRTPEFDRWPLQNSEPRLPYTYSITWSMQNPHRGTTNNYGHIAPFDYQRGSQPVLVMGDSFIESLMNEYEDTLQGQLGKRINAPNAVYGLAASGLSASDYVALSRLARDEFSPIAAILLIGDGDLSESLGRRTGNHFLVTDGGALKLDYAPLVGESVQKKIRKLIGDISIYRYFQVNLQFSIDKVFKVFHTSAPPGRRSEKPVDNVARQKMAADWFLSALPASLGLAPECIVLLVDTDRYAIYNPTLASPRKDSPEARLYLIEQAQERGIKVSDLESVFRQRYAADPAKFDYWPIDRHWNRLGHGIGAKEAYRLLFAPGEPQSCQKTSGMRH